MRKIFFGILFCCGITEGYAQQTDSLQRLELVTINGYLSNQPLLSAPSSAIAIAEYQIDQKAIASLVPVLNAVSGVRMEERSPGSYRLSIRGSLLRSPFGVRNIKIYFDGMPFTDAGGNSYLNLIAPTGIKRMEILKGPDGSIFGANSGGVVLIETMGTANGSNVGFKTGTYGLINQNASLQQTSGKWQYAINQEYQEADGYRDHSSMSRKYFQAQTKYSYSKGNELKISGFYSDLGYETPGGLTLAQLTANPRGSRPASPVAPSAAAQKAGIYNKTLFGGASNRIALSDRIANVTSLSGMRTDYENPFITNYETRLENSIALRSFFELKNIETKAVNTQAYLGWEYQRSNSDIINYGNKAGVRDTVQAADRIKAEQQFVFTRVSLQAGEHFKAEAAVSVNFFNYDFESLPQSKSFVTGSRTFAEQLMPRLALSYLFNGNVALRGTISRGYSPPTIAEVRASDAKINADIEAETGWNYEMGLRVKDKSERFYADASVFYYKLQNAIVRRVNASDRDYFVNAGGTKQNGIELQANYKLIAKDAGLLRDLTLSSAITLNDFTFDNYQIASTVFTGKRLTGVPERNFVNSISFDFAKGLSLFGQYQYTSDIPLNDANTTFADAYHLLAGKIAWRSRVGKRFKFEINAGGDNLLDKQYSLGNDINAFGNRFFNTAAPRNFFVGIKLIG